MFIVRIIGTLPDLNPEELNILRAKFKSAVHLIQPNVEDIFISLNGRDPKPPEVHMNIAFSLVRSIVQEQEKEPDTDPNLIRPTADGVLTRKDGDLL
jgi:hypothetical protein